MESFLPNINIKQSPAPQVQVNREEGGARIDTSTMTSEPLKTVEVYQQDGGEYVNTERADMDKVGEAEEVI